MSHRTGRVGERGRYRRRRGPSVGLGVTPGPSSGDDDGWGDGGGHGRGGGLAGLVVQVRKLYLMVT